MALITCEECGREISDKARACPGCGMERAALATVATPLDDAPVARGIGQEKTRESLAVFMVIGLVILAVTVGSHTSALLGIGLLLAGFIGIWKYYRG
ncbi:MAG: hypothetical protein ACOY5C_02880 [Pseudomonadota bacterium]